MRGLLLASLCCAPHACFKLRRPIPVDDSSIPSEPVNSSNTSVLVNGSIPSLPVNGSNTSVPVNSSIEPALVKPVGRHILYHHIVEHVGAGINDRIWMFNWLSDLATYNNATVHITGGAKGADLYLGKHSLYVSKWWARYVWVPPQCGSGPFNDLEPFEGCKIIDDADYNFSEPLFDGENGCVIVMRMYNYKHQRSFYLPADKMCHISVSAAIIRYAKAITRQKQLPERFGAVHIRRCDRLELNGPNGTVAHCTSPDVLASVMHKETDIKAWVVFWYAEPGYINILKSLVRDPKYKRTVIFEDELKLNPYQDGDNMITYMVAASIYKGMATVLVDTHHCTTGMPTINRKRQPLAMTKQRGQEEEERQALAEYLNSGSELLGLCGGNRTQRPHV